MAIHFSRFLRGTAAVAAVLVLGAGMAVAQPMKSQGNDMQGGQAAALMQQLQAKSNEIQTISQQLTELRDKALEANPELAEQREALRTSLEAGMGEAGYDVAEGRARMEKLQGRMQSGDLSAAEQQEAQQALRSEVGAMREAQGEAMEDEDFTARREALNEDMIAAMKELNPQAEELILDLQAAQREYQQLAQQAQAMQQQGSQRSAQ